MKNLLTAFSLVLAVMLFSQTAEAQKILLEDGDLSFLKGQKTLMITYDYSEMGVGRFATEEEYTTSKVTEHNENEAGKGEKWLAGWKNARKSYYEPKFEELINKYVVDINMIALPSKKDAKYTLILKTTFTEPGFNIGIMRKPASINVEYIFVETANPSTVLAKLSCRNIPGRDVMGYDFDAGTRIAEAYAKAGKNIGSYIVKNLK